MSFNSHQSIFDPIRLLCKNKQPFRKIFGLGMVRFGSLRISGSLSGEHISDVGSDVGVGHLV